MFYAASNYSGQIKWEKMSSTRVSNQNLSVRFALDPQIFSMVTTFENRRFMQGISLIIISIKRKFLEETKEYKQK
jgi:hypothetical protein